MRNSSTVASPSPPAPDPGNRAPEDEQSFLNPGAAADRSALAELRRGGTELERNPLLAVHEYDLEAYLRSLGLLGDAGMKVPCKYCRDFVTVDHVAAVFPLGGSIKIACDKPECQSALLEAIRQREVRL